MEIERRWLVKQTPGAIAKHEHWLLEQAYISATAEQSVRIRHSRLLSDISDDTFVLTVKTGRGLSREEVEISLTREQYNALLPTAVDKVSKLRYSLPLANGLIAELDHFATPCSGHKQVEVEFESEAQAISFIPPDWFGCDVTNDSRFTNANIAAGSLTEAQIILGKLYWNQPQIPLAQPALDALKEQALRLFPADRKFRKKLDQIKLDFSYDLGDAMACARIALNTIDIEIPSFLSNTDRVLNEVIGHEFCHLLVPMLYPGKGFLSEEHHGQEWLTLMHTFGIAVDPVDLEVA